MSIAGLSLQTETVGRPAEFALGKRIMTMNAIGPRRIFDRSFPVLFRVGLFVLLTSDSVQGSAPPNPTALPDFSEVLAECRAVAGAMPLDTTRAYVLRRIAVLEARSGDVAGAFRTLEAIQLTPSPDLQTAENLRQAGFIEMLEALVADGEAEKALRIAENATNEYAERRNGALGMIAIAQAKRGDAPGAKQTLHRMDVDTAHNFELLAAMYLGDKPWGRQIVRPQIEAKAKLPPNELRLRPGEWWGGEIYWLATLVWCGETDEARGHLDRIIRANQFDAETRKELEKMLAEFIAEPSAPLPPANGPKPKRTAAEIVEMCAEARQQVRSDRKADGLLEVAELLFELRRAAGK